MQAILEMKSIRIIRSEPSWWFATVAILGTMSAGLVHAQSAAGEVSIELSHPADSSNPIVIRFKGNMSQRQVPERIDGSRVDVIAFVSRLVKANKRGNPSAIRDLWRPEDRKELDARFANPVALERNTGFYKNVTHTAIEAEIAYGSTIIIVVRHSTPSTNVVTPYVVKRVEGRLLQTNELQSDPILSPMVSIVGEYLNRAKRR